MVEARCNGDGGLPVWIADHRLVAELEVEADRLRHRASRLAARRARVIADLAAEDTTGLRQDPGS